jgi:hypothetical protein
MIAFSIPLYSIFIEKSEKIVIISSTDPLAKPTKFTTSQRVYDIDSCEGAYMYITYYDSNLISSYTTKIQENMETGVVSIGIDHSIDFKFDEKYLAFDIDHSKLMIIFSGKNTIDVYEPHTSFFIYFIRRLPLYKYRSFMKFMVNKDETAPVFQRLDNCLYVIMVNEEDPSDKSIFIYDLSNSAHNSLKNIIHLDPNYSQFDNYLSVQKEVGFDSIFIYLFYEGRVYQFITYETESSLVNKFSLNNTFIENMKEGQFDGIEIDFEIYPVKTNDYQHQNQSLPAVVKLSNQGLIVKDRVKNSRIISNNENSFTKLALLDYFEGFNTSYSLKGYDEEDADRNSEFSFELSSDNMQEYLLESINSNQRVKYTFAFK